jgi:hypothetical protein
MALMSVAGSEMSEVDLDGVQRAFIVRNAPLERLLLNRNVLGLEFQRTCDAGARAFVRHFADELTAAGEDVAELVILTKGLCYGLRAAVATMLDRNLEANFAATRRVAVDGQDARVEVLYRDFDAARSRLIIGDTIASGATVCAALSAYLERQPLRSVHLFTFAGSGVGARRIGTFCREHGIDLTIAFGLAVFGLGDNGFDLSFLHPDTITADAYVQRATEQFNGKPVSAVGWDFGSQVHAVEKYRQLCWIEAQYWGIHDATTFAVARRPLGSDMVQRERGAWESRLKLGDVTGS